MANLLQGSALPDVSTTQTATTTAPDWYNSFLSGLATSGQQAVQQGGIAGPSELQQKAYSTAPTAITAGQPALTSAADIVTGAAAGPDINQFMNPYTAGVVNEIGRLGQQQFNELLAPSATAGAAGSGQFGSRRGMEVYGNVARDVARNILGQQTGALQTGFQNAVNASINEQQIKNQLAGTLAQLSGQAYTQGTGGLDVLSKLGAQQQAVEQARLNYPMTAEQNLANIIRGFNIPTTQTQTYKGPMPGAYSLSPLSQIAGLTTGAAGIFANKVDPTTGKQIPGTSVYDTIKNIFPSLSNLSSLVSGQPEQVAGPTSTPLDAGTSLANSGGTSGGITIDPNTGSYTTSSGVTINPSDYTDVAPSETQIPS